ncbi:MAG: helix-turn-helix transcriptional regulator [Butyrivibrio sp.]|nr:helix-turn-helix transcriptional regulator [Butyrivibrio sp.]
MAQLYESEVFIYNQVPVRIFNHYFDGTDIFTSLHWHRNVEFNLTTAGRIKYNVDGENKILSTGDFCIINSGVLHSNHWVEPGDHFEGICVQVSKSFIDRWIGENVYFEYPKKEEDAERIRRELIKFGEYKKQGKSDIEKMELVFDFLIMLKESCAITGKASEQCKDNGDINIKSIINYIDENYMEQLDLAGVSRAFNYTPAHLSRMFKEHVGKNFYQYLQNVRLMHCVDEMKEDENVRLIECALNHGFPNAKSFIQTFKKNFGCTPSDWMKQGKRAELLPE